MSLDEFFEELKKTPREWRINETGCVRSEDGACPVCAVLNRTNGKIVSFFNWYRAVEAGLMSQEDAKSIARAADNSWFKDDPCDPALRARLLECCGLTEAT